MLLFACKVDKLNDWSSCLLEEVVHHHGPNVQFISFHLADCSLGQSVVTWTERKTQSMHPGVNGLLMGDFKSVELTELIFSSS